MKNNKVIQRKFDFHQNKIKIIFICFVFVALLLFFTAVFKFSVLPASKRLSPIVENVITDRPVAEIVPSTQVDQTFSAQGKIIGFSLQFGTYSRQNKGTLHVSLLNTKNNRLVYQKEMTLSNLQDNQFQKFIFDSPISDSSSGQYKIIITTSEQSSADNAVTIFSSDKDSYTDGFCTVNGEKQAGDLCFKVYSGNYGFIIPVYTNFVVIILIAFLIMIYILLFKKSKIEYIFLISVICIGCIYLFLMPPQSIPDEPSHYETAYSYSNALMLHGFTKENGTMLQRADDTVNLNKFTTQPNIDQYNLIIQHLFEMVNNSKLTEINGNFVKMFPAVYLPAAVGITIARVLGIGSIALYYFGRLANLLFYAGAVFFAIKKIPFGKMIIFVTALLPMSIHQAASYSYDAIVNGLAFLFIGYCLNAAYGEEDLRRKDVITLCIMGALLAPAKVVYICICFLCLLIPKERFSTLEIHGNKKVVCVTAILASSIVTFFINSWLKVGGSLITNTKIVPWNNEPGYTAIYLLNHLGILLEIVFHTLQDNSPYYMETMLGQHLGWLNVNVNSFLISMFLILLVLSIFKEDDERIYFNRKDKWLIALIVGCVFTLVCVALLLTWTPLGWNVVAGVQGRYFLPILPLVLLLFRNSIIVLKRNINNILIFSIWLLQILTVANIFQLIIAVSK